MLGNYSVQRAALLAKILSRTVRSGECLLWQGAKNDDGYGNINVSWLRKLTGILTWKVHRLVYFLETDELPDSVLHACDTPACCELAHLCPGNQDLNMKDAAQKRRLRIGENHPKALLTQEQVAYIRSHYDAQGKAPYGTHRRLARELHVSTETIRQVREGRTWR